MNLLKTLRRPQNALVLILLTTAPAPCAGQQNMGDFLGPLIMPVVEPVLKRAAGEMILEGARQQYERGRLLPGRRRRSSGSGGRIIRPQPSQPVYREPQYQQPQYRPVQPVEATPAPSQPAAIEPPENQVVTRQPITPNVSPVDPVQEHAAVAGRRFAMDVISQEARSISQTLDFATLRWLDPRLSDSSGSAFRGAFRTLLSRPVPERTRADLIDAHRDTLQPRPEYDSLVALTDAADAAQRIIAASSGTHPKVIAAIEQLRNDVGQLRGDALSARELATLAERCKNLRNVAVLAELARVMAMQRSDDLLPRIAEASAKSDAPDALIAGVVGAMVGTPQTALGGMQLPDGNPTVLLYSPVENPGPVSFLCDDSLSLTLAPGELAPFGQSFVVSFKNGAGELKRYTLARGVYRWMVDGSGWDLRHRTKVTVSIDASHAPADFHFQLGGQPQMARAGTILELELEDPPRIDFDLGLGDGSTASTLLTPGDYVVGIHPESGTWDLFYRSDDRAGATDAATLARRSLIESVAAVRAGSSAGGSSAQVDALLDSIE